MRQALAIVILLCSAVNVLSQNSKDTKKTDKAEKHQQSAINPPSQTIAVYQEPARKDNGETGDQRQQEINIQRELNKLTSRLVVVGIVQSIVLLLQAILFFHHKTSLAQVAMAARDNAAHLANSERGWILVTKVALTAGAIDRPEGSEQVFIQCEVENVGRSASRVLEIKAILHTGPRSDPGQTWEERLYKSDGSTIPRWVVLPNRKTALNYPVPGHTANVGAPIVPPNQIGDAHFVHGVIRYWDMFSENDRFTRFCYRLEKDSPVRAAGFYCAGGDQCNQQT